MPVPDDLNSVVPHVPARQLLDYDAYSQQEVDADEEAGVLFYSTGIDGDSTEALTDAQQVALLRGQLAEKDQAILRAEITRTRIEQELAETKESLDSAKEEADTQKAQLQQALYHQRQIDAVEDSPKAEAKTGQEALDEIAHLKTEIFRAQKALDRERRARSAELERARTQAQEIQNNLEKENRARRLEAAQASARVAILRKELDEIQQSGSAGVPIHLEGHRKGNLRLIVGGVAAAVALGVVVTWTQFTAHASAPAQAPVSQAALRDAPVPQSAPVNIHDSRGALPVPTPIPLSRFSPESRGNFAASLSRLSRVLTGFPGRSPEEVLHSIHVAYAKTDPNMCSFDWNHGQPALLYTGDRNKLSLSGTLTRCAEALENFR